MRAVVVIPFHEPRWLENTRANLERQTVKAPALLMLNGGALDLEPDFALYIEDSNVHCHADAVNRGALAAERTGFTHAVLMDSDDYYGPEYVATQLAALEHADYVGKRAIFTWLGDGLHLFERAGGQFMGGTLGFSLKAFCPMPAVLQDDTEWCRRMASSGALGADTGPAHYCYVRHGGNAHWRAGDMLVRRAWGPSCHHPEAQIADVGRNPGSWRVAPIPADADVIQELRAH